MRKQSTVVLDDATTVQVIKRKPRVPLQRVQYVNIKCVHTLTCADSVLSTACGDSYIYAATESGQVTAWNAETYLRVASVKGHEKSVLATFMCEERNLFFTSSGDGYIKAWRATPESLMLMAQYHFTNPVGDIYGLEILPKSDYLFAGCQNNSIQVIDISNLVVKNSPSDHMNGTVTAVPDEVMSTVEVTPAPDSSEAYKVRHHGYVYSLASLRLGPEGGFHLVSGGGDGSIKIWRVAPDGDEPLQLRTTFTAHDGGILSIVTIGRLIISAGQDGCIKVWDGESLKCRRKLKAHNDDVLALCYAHDLLFSASADGLIHCLNPEYTIVDSLTDHSGPVLSITPAGENHFVSGGGDGELRVWQISLETATTNVNEGEDMLPTLFNPEDDMYAVLEQLIAYRTVSAKESCINACWDCAQYLRECFESLGAETKLDASSDESPPIVMARFDAKENPKSQPTVLIYAHYDVQPANSRAGATQWRTDPFELRGIDGYLYGRGVTDNKGPLVAMIFAVRDLLDMGQLDVNVGFVVDGSEEIGSKDFRGLMANNLDFFGETSYILISNSYWIGDTHPCLIYGLRGVVRFDIVVESQNADLHSGIEGGTINEPFSDMTKLLGSLVNSEAKCLVPGFYDDVAPLTSHEEALYDQFQDAELKYSTGEDLEAVVTKDSRELLMKRWREPTCSIHSVRSSGPGTDTVIPHKVTAKVSMRIVASQRINDVVSKTQKHLEDIMAKIGSGNKLTVTDADTGDWWQGDYNSPLFQAASQSIEEHWGKAPFLTREGGSIPMTSYLEQIFGAKALHMPMGQSSDGAHLANERTRLLNLQRGRQVTKTLLQNLR
eukprot:Clim_evm74s172 gene=Clim_evmTU74s172